MKANILGHGIATSKNHETLTLSFSKLLSVKLRLFGAPSIPKILSPNLKENSPSNQ
jgi:hypothetical protein